MIARADTDRPLVVQPSIGRLYLILSPDRLAGVLESALLAAVAEAREADPSYAPPCDPRALVKQAREGLALVWSDVEPALAAFRDGCATAGAAKAARDEAAHAERERVIREREAQAARDRVEAARKDRETKSRAARDARATEKAGTDRTSAERELVALRARLAALETALASS